MLEARFGIEVEFTGITRTQAAQVVAEHLGGSIENYRDSYDTKKITAQNGRVWEIMSDASIRTQKKLGGQTVSATGDKRNQRSDENRST